MKGRCLQSCSNNDKTHGHPDHASSTEKVANSKIDNTSKKCTQAITGDSDTRNYISSDEASFELRVFKQATEDTLVITEEKEGAEASHVDGSPQRGTSSKNGPHVDNGRLCGKIVEKPTLELWHLGSI